MRSKLFEVYVCIYNGEIVYVGSGIVNRHKHCISGISNVYELNRHHFNGDSLSVEVLSYFYSKDESLDYELLMIKKHSPRYNKVHNCFSSNALSKTKIKENFKVCAIKCGARGGKLKMILDTFDEMLNYFSAQHLKDGKITLYPMSYYKEGTYMSKLVRYVKYGNKQRGGYCYLFMKAFEGCFGYNLDSVVK